MSPLATLLRPASDQWTVDDLERLPDNLRCEIRNGKLVIMSPVKVWHEDVAAEIRNSLRRAGRFASTNVTIKRVATDTRMPDVAVFREPPDLQASVHSPDNIELVVEVWSPSSDTKDHEELRWYAERGIAEYWLAEPIGDGRTLTATITRYVLATSVDGEPLYVQAGVTTLADLMAGN